MDCWRLINQGRPLTRTGVYIQLSHWTLFIDMRGVGAQSGHVIMLFILLSSSLIYTASSTRQMLPTNSPTYVFPDRVTFRREGPPWGWYIRLHILPPYNMARKQFSGVSVSDGDWTWRDGKIGAAGPHRLSRLWLLRRGKLKSIFCRDQKIAGQQ